MELLRSASPKKRTPRRKRKRTKGKKQKRSGKGAKKNKRKAKKKKGGLRVFATPQGPEVARGLRACLLDALLPLMPEEMREATRERIVPLLSEEEDTSVSEVAPALGELGVEIDCVSGRYLGKKEAPLLILKERECRLILRLHFRFLDYEWNHFVAWDGRVIHDSPASSIVNDTTDRASVEAARIVFDRTFYEWKWEITGVYELQFK